MPAQRGKPQNRRLSPGPDNPNELVLVRARVPAHLRAKVLRNAAASGMSLAGYLEQQFAALPELEAPSPLPLPESA